jgi:hypothetical protein
MTKYLLKWDKMANSFVLSVRCDATIGSSGFEVKDLTQVSPMSRVVQRDGVVGILALYFSHDIMQ